MGKCLVLNSWFLLLLPTCIFAQDTLKLEATNFEVDPLNRLILIEAQQGDTWCYDAKLDLLAYNQINVWGNVLQLDLNDPMKPLAFFPDVNRISLFDEMLSAAVEIDLDFLNLPNVQAVGSASLGGFWVFSRDENKVLRINQAGTRLYESSDLNFVLGGYPVVTSIRETDDRLILTTADGLVCVFDFFGYLDRKIQLGPSALTALDEGILYIYESDRLYAMDLSTKNPDRLFLTQFSAPLHAFAIKDGMFYALYPDQLIRMPLDELIAQD